MTHHETMLIRKAVIYFMIPYESTRLFFSRMIQAAHSGIHGDDRAQFSGIYGGFHQCRYPKMDGLIWINMELIWINMDLYGL